MRLNGCARVGLIAAMAVLGAATAARGQVLADRVPADAMVYAGWAGSDAQGAAYGASHLKGFLEALGLQDFFAGRLNAEIAKVQGTQQGDDVKLLQDWLAAMAKAPTAIYFNGLELPPAGGAQGVPHLSLFSRVGKQTADALAEKLDALFHRNQQPAAPLHGVKAVGEYLLVFVGDDAMVARLQAAAPADNLAGVENFQKALAQVGAGPAGADAARPAAVVYVDGEALVQWVDNAVKNGPDPDARKNVPLVAEGLGVNGLKQLAWAGSFDGANWQSRGFVGMRDRRHGLLAFLDNPPLTDASLKLIPKSATTAGAFRFDATRLLADAKETAAAVDDALPAQLETAFKQAWVWTGVDFNHELLPALGDEFIYYGSSDAAGNSLMGLTLVNRLKDAKKAQSAFEAAENFTNLLILQRNPDSKMQFHEQALPAPLQNVKAHVMVVDGFTPSWAIQDGTLFMSASVAGLQSAIETATAKKESMLDNPQFIELHKKLGQEKFSSFSYADLSKSAPESYQLVSRGLATALAAAAPQLDPKERYSLPPLNRLLPHMGPVLKLNWSDAAGFHTRATAPFIGADYLGPASFLGLRLAELLQQRRQAPADGLP